MDTNDAVIKHVVIGYPSENVEWHGETFEKRNNFENKKE